MKKPFACRFCAKTFERPQGRGSHEFRKHRPFSEVEPVEPIEVSSPIPIEVSEPVQAAMPKDIIAARIASEIAHFEARIQALRDALIIVNDL